MNRPEHECGYKGPKIFHSRYLCPGCYGKGPRLIGEEPNIVPICLTCWPKKKGSNG